MFLKGSQLTLCAEENRSADHLVPEKCVHVSGSVTRETDVKREMSVSLHKSREKEAAQKVK
jgi:hypothetical protein